MVCLINAVAVRKVNACDELMLVNLFLLQTTYMQCENTFLVTAWHVAVASARRLVEECR